MRTSPESRFRTDLTAYLLDLLDFIDERIKESQNDPVSRKNALSEAMGVLPIMKDRLNREDQKVLTQLLLIGFFDEDLTQLAELSADEVVKKIDVLYQRHAMIRNILDSLTTSSAP